MDQKLAQAIQTWIDEHAEEYIADVQALSRIPSVSRADEAAPGAPFGPGCREALDWALKRSAELGFETEDHDGYCGSAYLGDKHNAIGAFGHIDVVPIADGWIYPPYGATCEGDLLFGRGVSDDKGPALCALYAARCVKELDIPMKHGFHMYFGCAEETGMADLQYFIKHAVLPVTGFVPDCGFPVCIAQKGSFNAYVRVPVGPSVKAFDSGLAANIVPTLAVADLCCDEKALRAAIEAQNLPEGYIAVEAIDGGARVTAYGLPAHGADPEKGRSALKIIAQALSKCAGILDETSLKAMQAVAELTRGCYGESCGLQSEDPISGRTTTNFGIAHLVDGELEVRIDARVALNVDINDAETRFLAATEPLGFSYRLERKTQPFHLKDDDPAVVALTKVYREQTGRDDANYAMGGGTYSRYLPTVISYGPGLRDEYERPQLPEGHGGAHQCDEYAHIPSLLKAMRIYVHALLELDQAL